jgi:hypothetical protein
MKRLPIVLVVIAGASVAVATQPTQLNPADRFETSESDAAVPFARRRARRSRAMSCRNDARRHGAHLHTKFFSSSTLPDPE